MKKLLIGSMFAAAFGASALAYAASTTLAVSASVTGSCKFNSASTNLAFGAIDPSSLVAKTASASVVFRCTTGTTSAITANNGLHFLTGGTPRMQNPAITTNYLNYTLTLIGDVQVGTGFGGGGDKTLTVNGSIAVADFQNAAAAASFVDTVVLTITP